MTRAYRVLRNAIFCCIYWCVQLIITFIGRAIFVRHLSAEYLGLNSLYTNMISILSVADLGFETVLMYMLYKPIAESNNRQIILLLSVFKRIYQYVALVIFLIGILIIPCLPVIVKSSSFDNSELLFYYVLFLINSSCSYFMVYKSTLLLADQNVYVVKLIKLCSLLICFGGQVITLVLFNNYIGYLIVTFFTTLINNLILSQYADRRYPYLAKIKTNKTLLSALDITTRNTLINNVKSMIVYKLSATLINSTSSILISILLGTIVVGYYTNYSSIIMALMSLVGILGASLTPSIGNYISSQSDGVCQERLFHSTIFIYFIIATVTSGSLLLSINDIVAIWVGEKFILSSKTVILIIINFYLQCVALPLSIFRETTGLFKEIKFNILLMAILNIIFSIVLGKIIGLPGIIVATSIARLLTLFWYEPKLIYKKIFKVSFTRYWIKWCKYFALSLLAIMISLSLVYYLEIDEIIIKTIISVLLTLVTTIFIYMLPMLCREEINFWFIRIKNVVIASNDNK